MCDVSENPDDPVPTEADWRSEPWGLDTPCAYQHLFGKTIAETVRLFEENSLCYREDLRFMPARAFRYYILAYCAYLLSDAAQGDSDGASALIRVIRARAEHQPEVVRSQWPVIEAVLARLAADQEYYDADWLIYGDFRTRIHDIVELGFAVSFDTASPEIVPAGLTLADVKDMDRVVSAPVAIQVFRNSGISGISETSTKDDVLRVFGEPEKSGGGEHPQFGMIPDWICYQLPECRLRFGFNEDRISDVTFMPVDDPITPMVTKNLQELKRKFVSVQRFEELFDPDATQSEPAGPRLDDLAKGFGFTQPEE